MVAIAINDIAEYISILDEGKKTLSAAGAKRTDRVIRKLQKKMQ